MTKFTRKTNEEKKAEVQAAMEKIEEGVKNVFTSENYKDFLKSMSYFNNYSLNNQLLITLQKPEASKVCSYTTWKNEFNRQVKKGEKGIKILAPAPYKKDVEVEVEQPDGTIKTETQKREFMSFKMTSCFDISQTEGEPVPELCKELLGEDDRAKAIIEAVHEVSKCPIEKKSEKELGSSYGYFSPSENLIAIRDDLSEIQEAKTSIHEYTHSLLHGTGLKDTDKDREQIEIEAESTAFVICNHFGLNTDEYSFPYVAAWSRGKEPEELKKILNDIKSNVVEIINNLEPTFLRIMDQLQYKEYTNEENMELSNGYFLNIHECDDGGYDYTIYNEEKILLDGGVVETEDIKEVFEMVIDELGCTNKIKEVDEIEENILERPTLNNVIEQAASVIHSDFNNEQTMEMNI